MRIVSRNDIEIRERQRTDPSLSVVNDLKASILAFGLFNPPVCWFDKAVGHWVLSSGETRLRAIDAIAADGLPFDHNGISILPGQIPITSLADDLSEIQLFEAELEENERRYELSWQDRARALARLHELKRGDNPSQSFQATARDLQEQGIQQHVNTIATAVRESAIIAKHLGKESVQKARNAKEALQIILKDEGAALEAEMISRRIRSATTATVVARQGDSFLILPSLDAGQFDLILADPPYGVEAGGSGFRSRSVHHHNYEDTPERARDFLKLLVTEGFRLTKPKANLFIFGDIDHFPYFKQLCSSMGWTPFRTPLTWLKSDSEGMAPWGASGPRRTCEWIFYATKGSKGLWQSPTDTLRFSRVPRHERVYGPEKPVDLLKQLIEVSTMPNDFILDPCCGAGSSLAAAHISKRRALGIELNQDAYNFACVRAAGDDPANTEEDAC